MRSIPLLFQDAANKSSGVDISYRVGTWSCWTGATSTRYREIAVQVKDAIIRIKAMKIKHKKDRCSGITFSTQMKPRWLWTGASAGWEERSTEEEGGTDPKHTTSYVKHGCMGMYGCQWNVLTGVHWWSDCWQEEEDELWGAWDCTQLNADGKCLHSADAQRP